MSDDNDDDDGYVLDYEQKMRDAADVAGRSGRNQCRGCPTGSGHLSRIDRADQDCSRHGSVVVSS
jgi:hypothetical protein